MRQYQRHGGMIGSLVLLFASLLGGVLGAGLAQETLPQGRDFSDVLVSDTSFGMEMNASPSVTTGAMTPNQLPIGTASGRLREVDVVHIGGSPNGPTAPIVVTAAGTGAAVRLTSWRLGFAPQPPNALQDSPNITGHDAQLHVLTPDITPKLSYELLLSAVIREGNLWLTSWRINGAGNFTQLDSRGYGANADLQVKAYAVAYREQRREGDLESFQVVTPILSSDARLRLATWRVNADTGVISGLHDSGDWEADPHPDTSLATTRIEGDAFLPDYYGVSFRTRAGILSSYFWQVSGNGVPSYRGQGVSGVDIRGTSEVAVLAQHVAVGPLPSGFVSAVHDDLGGVELISWDNQLSCFGDTGCFAQPHYISNDGADGSPGTNGVQIADPTIVANRALVMDANYGDTLFSQNVDSTGPQGIGSVTKVMTLIVALRAIAATEVSLDDDVLVSAAAATVGGSQLGLSEGETQSLRTMLYGLMVNSGNDAAIAIAEHVGAAAGGDMATFVARMNLVASELGMGNTTYCQPAGGCFSTPADQVTLWHSVYADPEFQQFTGPVNYMGCGESQGGEEVCYFIDKTTDNYPGLDGWKGGSLGFFCPEDPETDGLPLCASGGCLSAQATRLGRTLIINELQPQPLVANRWPDAQALFDYGYRELFTPDARGASAAAGTTPDFGIDVLTDSQAVVGTIDGQRMRLCLWEAYAPSGQLNELACTNHAVDGLAASAHQPLVQEVEMVRSSSLEADGDFLVGHRDGEDLILQLWRVGEKDF